MRCQEIMSRNPATCRLNAPIQEVARLMADFGGNEVISCRPDDDVDQARQLMRQKKVQRILVCDDQKKPVGVISLQDIAQSESEGEVGETVRGMKEEGGARVH